MSTRWSATARASRADHEVRVELAAEQRRPINVRANKEGDAYMNEAINSDRDLGSSALRARRARREYVGGSRPAWKRRRALRLSEALQEIVVTAEKRESTVQKTPISITAISGADLQAQGISDMLSVAQQVPGISFKTSGPGTDRVRDARPDLHRRRVADRGLLSRRCRADSRRDGAERQDRHRPEPLRSEPRRDTARPAGHAVRRGLDGRHGQARDQSTGSACASPATSSSSARAPTAAAASITPRT